MTSKEAVNRVRSQ